MPNTEKRALGAVAFNEDAMMFIAKALTGNEASTTSTAQCAAFNEKSRWAYLVVGYKESEALRKNNKDNASLLAAIKDKYAPFVKAAITENRVSKRSEIRNLQVKKSGKNIKLVHSVLCATKSIEELLVAFDMHAQAKALQAVHKEKGVLETRMVLPLFAKECHQMLQEEKADHKKEHAFAVVAWAFGYKGKDDALELLPLDNNPIIALLPRTRLECGVFFDGTNNNKFNIQMRLDYEKFLDDKNERIRLKTYTDGSWEKGIIEKLPKSKVLPLIFKDLKENISSYGYNTKKSSEYNGGWLFGLWQDKISEDADAVYDYFHDEDREEVDVFVEKKLLPLDFIDKLFDSTESSYTGATTNVVKLYDHYETQINNYTYKDKHLYKCYRKKLYVTGAGTHDSRKNGEAKDDEVFLGSALAMSETGVVSKVEQACKDLRGVLKSLDTQFVDTLVLDVFGFSRGAAEARHFVGSISKELDDVIEVKKPDNKGKTYTEYELSKAGENLYPFIIKEKASEKDEIIINKIIFRFVGVFDTVPHYGLSQDNDVKELNLTLHPNKVSKLLHLTALQEYRHNFDLVSIFSKHTKDNGLKIEDNFEEREFFGAHSDVGGGYNNDKAEFVELPSQYFYRDHSDNDEKVKRMIKRWNQKFQWVKHKNIQFLKDKDEIVKNQNRIYIVKHLHRHRQQHTVIRISSKYCIYMYRKNLFSNYNEIPLEYMYKHAKQYIPMKPLQNLKYKKIDMLYNNKDAIVNLKKDALKMIISDYIHHSSSLSIANSPNEGTQNILYGERTIHYI